MKSMSLSVAYGCALSIMVLGPVGCDMSEEEDLENVDDESAGDELEQQAVDEALLDPARAVEAAQERIDLLGPEVISRRHNLPCGTTRADIDSSPRVNDASSPNAANQRSGPSTSCAINGVLQPTDDADYHCFTIPNDGAVWTYLGNVRTGVHGWVRGDLLRDTGSFVHCN